mmetsp:Transcript_27501/g.60336  ORF Transcript_27501/g.60336 Transcript_27501/m.60336 type:complete len:236 (+) Transcript_27501:496-1203(+)
MSRPGAACRSCAVSTRRASAPTISPTSSLRRSPRSCPTARTPSSGATAPPSPSPSTTATSTASSWCRRGCARASASATRCCRASPPLCRRGCSHSSLGASWSCSPAAAPTSTSSSCARTPSLAWASRPASGTFATFGARSAGSHPSSAPHFSASLGATRGCPSAPRRGERRSSPCTPSRCRGRTRTTRSRTRASSRLSFQCTARRPFAMSASCMRSHTARQLTSIPRQVQERTVT